jgi:hypothetical protein
MTGTVFGDFVDLAEAHLAAASTLTYREPGIPAGVEAELGRFITRLARYLDDHTPVYAARGIGLAGVPAWDRAILDAHAALHWAATSLAPGHNPATPPGNQPAEDLASHLATSGAALAAGRDLLHTHFTLDPAGTRTASSYWAPAITSGPVTAALLSELVGLC